MRTQVEASCDRHDISKISREFGSHRKNMSVQISFAPVCSYRIELNMRLNVIFSELVPQPSFFKLITRFGKVFLEWEPGF
ncbi:hypothetical protein MicvaDRAFT_3277 [Microcoleus vaginatus FGP-2]|nr:hypothetical protein MicvaDRAFT_3277 [Microcoleus vaginatus FGP-2]